MPWPVVVKASFSWRQKESALLPLLNKRSKYPEPSLLLSCLLNQIVRHCNTSSWLNIKGHFYWQRNQTAMSCLLRNMMYAQEYCTLWRRRDMRCVIMTAQFSCSTYVIKYKAYFIDSFTFVLDSTLFIPNTSAVRIPHIANDRPEKKSVNWDHVLTESPIHYRMFHLIIVGGTYVRACARLCTVFFSKYTFFNGVHNMSSYNLSSLNKYLVKFKILCLYVYRY